MNKILSQEEVGYLTVFDGLTHIETPLLAEYIRYIEQAILKKLNSAEPRSYIYKHRYYDGSFVWSHKDTLNGTNAVEAIPLFTHPQAPSAVEWAEAYAAFKGAFDTPQMRRQISDEYSHDARKRLREFNEAMLAAARSE